MTTVQARAAGLTQRQLATLVRHGWRRQTQGIYLAPELADGFRASIRGALLACPDGTTSETTAGRLYGLWGLPKWTASELPCLLYPAGRTYNARRGIKLRSGLQPGESVIVAGIPTTTLGLTVAHLSRVLRVDDLVCALDSALRLGWRPGDDAGDRPPHLRSALALADGRSESALETRLRLLLTRAGLPPEAVQFEVRREDGSFVARVDLAYPSVRLAVEVDGKEVHQLPEALFRDRERANDLVEERWRVIRFTWRDVMYDPESVIRRIRKALTE